MGARVRRAYISSHGAWRSLVAHLLWEQGVGGSNPLAPTTGAVTCGCSSMVELQPSKLAMGVRFPSPALRAPVAKGTEQRTSNPRKYVHGCQLRSSKTSYLSGMRLRALLRVCHSLVSTADTLSP